MMHYKPYADSTLKSMKKEELIGIIRCLEHNWASTEEANQNQWKILTQRDINIKCRIEELRKLQQTNSTSQTNITIDTIIQELQNILKE